MIEAYSFGTMTINGRAYTKDVMIMPDGGIVCPWIRNTGHELQRADIKAVIRSMPNILVAGTGAYGRMTIIPGLDADLRARGIQLIAEPTQDAVVTFNTLKEKPEIVAGCFHLTC